MTITIFFDLQGTASQYDQVWRELEKADALAPAGRLYHVAQPDGDRWSVVDVWESKEQFEAFGQVLLPILHKVGIGLTPPKVLPTHNIVKPR